MAKDWTKGFYQSKAWRAARAAALRRDVFTCQMCEGWATEVHHIIELTPENINTPLAYDLDNLQSLCWLCHSKETKGQTDVIEGFYFNEDGQVSPLSEKEKG